MDGVQEDPADSGPTATTKAEKSPLAGTGTLAPPRIMEMPPRVSKMASRIVCLLKARWRSLVILAALLVIGAFTGLGLWVYLRYAVSPVMEIPITEFSNSQYAEDPALRSVHFGQYSGRRLKLIQRDATHFDFVLEPTRKHVATVVFRDVDISLMTPSEPAWAKGDKDLQRIALTDRQWNRQQVSFDPHSAHVEVSGGNGFERENLFTAELAKNCLNAGLWEVLLFVRENGRKALYYHGWFTFPLGHYKAIFERNTGVSYWKHWHKLEHWSDPAGTPVRLDALRQVRREQEVPASFDTYEPVILAGEQIGKRRTTDGEQPLIWGDFYDGRKINFATFVPPGRYDLQKAWKNEYWRLAAFNKAILRDIVSAAGSRTLQELELVFNNKDGGGQHRFLVSGFELTALPQLALQEYPQGFYMPMGIGVPPFFQSYDELVKNPPDNSPYFSVLLDSNDRWINHHEVAVDGPVMHLDLKNPHVLHVYLLSYERHSLIAHFVISTEGWSLGTSKVMSSMPITERVGTQPDRASQPWSVSARRAS